MNSIILQIFVYFIIIQALFLSVHFFTIQKPNLKSNRILGYLLLSFAVSIFAFRLVLDLPSMSPVLQKNLYITHILLSFLMYILFFIYIKSLYNDKFPFNIQQNWIHITGVIAYLIFCQIMIKQVPSLLQDNLKTYTAINTVKVGLYFTYLMMVVSILKREFISLSRFFSIRENPNLLWLMVLTGSFFFLWLLESFILVVILFDLTVVTFNFIVIVSVVAPFLFVNAILIMALKKPMVFYAVQNANSWSMKEEDQRKYLTRFVTFMEQKELFKDPDLSLNKISEQLEINPKYLSLILHEHLQTSFPDIINRYRIESAKKIMENGSEQTIQQTMFAVGYNSKSAFNQHFKRIMGCTPSAYKAKVSKSRN